MYQTLRVQKVLANVTRHMHFILAHVTDFSKHVAPVLLPSDRLWERDGDLTENRVCVHRYLTVCHSVKHHEFVLVGKLTREHTLEQLLDLALLA